MTLTLATLDSAAAFGAPLTFFDTAVTLTATVGTDGLPVATVHRPTPAHSAAPGADTSVSVASLARHDVPPELIRHGVPLRWCRGCYPDGQDRDQFSADYATFIIDTVERILRPLGRAHDYLHAPDAASPASREIAATHLRWVLDELAMPHRHRLRSPGHLRPHVTAAYTWRDGSYDRAVTAVPGLRQQLRTVSPWLDNSDTPPAAYVQVSLDSPSGVGKELGCARPPVADLGSRNVVVTVTAAELAYLDRLPQLARPHQIVGRAVGTEPLLWETFTRLWRGRGSTASTAADVLTVTRGVLTDAA